MSATTNSIIHGDSMNVLEEIEPESVHAVVCDPPYGLAFMGRDWDDFDPLEYQQWCMEWADKALEILKPGGHLVAFSGNRTHHRLFSGVEDAGFEVRDTLTWHYGSGFPKNTDTQLKPATEFAILARAPCNGTASECNIGHGTAYLNIDDCRIPTDEEWEGSEMPDANPGVSLKGSESAALNSQSSGSHDEGRYPANVALDVDVAKMLDEQTGDVSGADLRGECDGTRPGGFADVGSESGDGTPNARVYADDGGPSRFFYTSKASTAERTMDGAISNEHPTVKPLDLMEWLVTMVSADGQLVLDPFAGSGTTCRAAKNLNREFIGIEQSDQWADVARVRCGLEPANPAHVRSNDNQFGLEQFQTTS